MLNTIYDCEETKKIAMKQAKGSYQIALVEGGRRWSGADIGGKAAEYGMGYTVSRRRLLARIEEAGLKVTMKKEKSLNYRHIMYISQKTIIDG